MPRTKAQDAERKRLAYKNNEEYREKHKDLMRQKYHHNKKKMASLRAFGDAVHGIEPPSPNDPPEPVRA